MDSHILRTMCRSDPKWNEGEESRHDLRGFSLVELAVAMGVVAILSSVITPMAVRFFEIKAAEKTVLEVAYLQEAARHFFKDHKASWPKDFQELKDGGYINSTWSLLNPWGNAYSMNTTPLMFFITTDVPVNMTGLLAMRLPQVSPVGVGSTQVTSAINSFYTDTAVPLGVIAAWSGTLAGIPHGWALCDGSPGTPNLTNKFILMVSSAKEDPGATGGYLIHHHSGVTSYAGKHHHLTASGVNNRNDQYVRSNRYGTESVVGGAEYFIGFDGIYDNAGSSYQAYRTSDEGEHTHTFTTDDQPNLPPYYKLAFIIKVEP